MNEMYYNGTLILNYCINYPQFIAEKNTSFIKKLNYYYLTKSQIYKEYIETKLYKRAIDDFENAIALGLPIEHYAINSKYNITYNYNFGLSLYFDHYEHTGGAHGITHRIADTWDIRTGKSIMLKDLFFQSDYDINHIIEEIQEQAFHKTNQTNGIYYEDYKSLISANFDIESFYLVPEGVMVYYQLYEIAPFEAGISTFLIPFSNIQTEKRKLKYKG